MCLFFPELTFGEIVKIIQVVFWAITLVIAAKGLSTWKKQLEGTSFYETVKRFKRNLYDVQNRFFYVRNPAIWEQEYPAGGKVGYESTRYVYEKRMETLNKSFIELENSVLDMQVLLGRGFSEKMQEIRTARAKLLQEIKYLVRVEKDGDRAGRFYAEKVSRDEHTEILYTNVGGEKKNSFDLTLEKIVVELEGIVKRKEEKSRLTTGAVAAWKRLTKKFKKD